MPTLGISSTLGLIALGILALNAVLGIAVWSRKKIRLPRGITSFKVHKWTGYTAAAAVVLHVVLIPIDAESGFRWVDLPLPLWTKHQPVANSLGAAALWALGLVVVTSYFQRAMGFRIWRKFHYLAYAAFALFLIHGLITDPELKDRAVDWLDAEKVFVEVCALVILVATAFRLRRQRRIRAARVAGIGALALVFCAERANAQQSPTPGHLKLDPDAGLVWHSGDARWTTWGFVQGVVANDAGPYWRRVRQGMSLELPRLEGIRPAAVYEVDLTDNNFFRSGPKWKVFENAFLALQNAEDPSRFQVLYGQNTHILSREDNLSSGNLPTINRSIILESHGSVHALGTQWGGQVRGRGGESVAFAASAGDNTGSLNQDSPHFGALNDFAAKASVLAWTGPAREALRIEGALDYTRTLPADANFVLGSALGAAPLAAASVGGHRLTGEMDVELNGGTVPVIFEAEWIASSFAATDVLVHGGYAQTLVRMYGSDRWGDLSVLVRPEFAFLDAPGVGSASLRALRSGLDWNLPWTEQRANALLEGAWHYVAGEASVVLEHRPAWELRLMLRLSMTRHVRFQ